MTGSLFSDDGICQMNKESHQIDDTLYLFQGRTMKYRDLLNLTRNQSSHSYGCHETGLNHDWSGSSQVFDIEDDHIRMLTLGLHKSSLRYLERLQEISQQWLQGEHGEVKRPNKLHQRLEAAFYVGDWP